MSRHELLVRFLQRDLVFASLSLFALLNPCRAQESDDFPAVRPEVQTAAWAQEWWMPRHEEKLAGLKEVDQVDLLMIGDSITHGWESGGQKVWEEFYADRNAFNIGFSGDRTEQVIWRLQNGEVEGISPKLIVMMIGTNNTGHRKDPPAETAAGIEKIVEILKEKLPESKILLLAIFPRGATPDDELRTINDGTNERMAAMADEQSVFFLDINETFLEDDGTLPTSVMPDLLHPNGEGYRMWAEAMEPKVKELLGED